MKIFKTLLAVIMAAGVQVQGCMWDGGQHGERVTIFLRPDPSKSALYTSNHQVQWQPNGAWYGQQEVYYSYDAMQYSVDISNPDAARVAWDLAGQTVEGSSWLDQSWLAAFIPQSPFSFDVDRKTSHSPQQSQTLRSYPLRPDLNDVSAWKGMADMLSISSTPHAQSTTSTTTNLSRSITRVDDNARPCWTIVRDSQGNPHYINMNDPDYKFTHPTSPFSTWPVERYAPRTQCAVKTWS
jgi:hypothetical protein